MQSRHALNFFRTKGLACISVLAALLVPAILNCQSPPRSTEALWKESLRPAAKGTRIAVPSSILKETKVDQDEYPMMEKDDEPKVDAYLYRKEGFHLIAVQGRSNFCGATGNCAFWIYRLHGGKFDQILATGLTQNFGFLKLTTSGLPDLVILTHNSAQSTLGALWVIDDHAYEEKCRWEITTDRRLPDGSIGDGPLHIEADSCRELRREAPKK
jgi:hypothetical protein